MSYLTTLLNAIAINLNKLGAWVILPVMTLMMATDVALRYIFNAPLSWGLEASQHLLFLVLVCGLLEGFRSGAHVRMDLLYRLMPGFGRRLVTLFYAFCAIGIFALVAIHGGKESAFLKEINQVTQFIHMPIWLFYAALVGVAALIVIFFLLRSVEVLKGERDEIEDEHNPFGETS